MAITHLVDFHREVVCEHLGLLFQKLDNVFGKAFLGAVFLCPATLGTVQSEHGEVEERGWLLGKSSNTKEQVSAHPEEAPTTTKPRPQQEVRTRRPNTHCQRKQLKIHNKTSSPLHLWSFQRDVTDKGPANGGEGQGSEAALPSCVALRTPFTVSCRKSLGGHFFLPPYPELKPGGGGISSPEGPFK